VKNAQDRLVVLNRPAGTAVREMRGKHPTHVFSYKSRPIEGMYNSGWKEAGKRAGLPVVRVHDLKHSPGRRSRAAGVSFEDRQDLLGHKSPRITTHYSQAELENLVSAAHSVCGDTPNRGPSLVILRRNLRAVG
jgi:integrase